MLNKVELIGRLGADPEMRYTQNGDAIATVSLATTRRWKDKQSGEKKEETEWHRVTAFKRLAEILGEYTKKGSLIQIEGRINTQKWQKDGVDQYSTGVIAESMIMLDTKPEGTQSNIRAGEPPRQQAQQSQQKPAQQGQQSLGNSSMPEPPPYDNNYADFDDDIPF